MMAMLVSELRPHARIGAGPAFASRSGAGRLAVLVWAAVIVAVVSAVPARAQFMMGGGQGDQMIDRISKRSAAAYATLLGLDDAQVEALNALVEAYNATQKDLAEKMQREMAELAQAAQDSGDWRAFGDSMRKRSREASDAGLAQQRQFLEDVRGLLTAEQEPRMIRVERHRRRETGMRFSLMSGSGVDLVRIAQQTNAIPEGDAGKEARELLEQYEADLDRVLTAQERAMIESMEKLLGDDAEGSPMAQVEIFKSWGEFGKQTRDMSRDYARRLMPLLREEAREAFDMQIKQRSFPRVYKETHADKTLSAALGMDSLSADQRQQLEDIRASHERERGTIRERWAAAIEERENAAGGSLAAMMEGFMGQNQNKPNAVAEARTARADLDKGTIQRVRGVLNATQAADLPKAPPPPANPWEGMMDDFFVNEEE